MQSHRRKEKWEKTEEKALRENGDRARGTVTG
jgi:hypothetical protein